MAFFITTFIPFRITVIFAIFESMSSIKPKSGKCLECQPADGEKLLMAKRCFTAPHFHYQKHQQAKYAAKSQENKRKKTARAAAGTGMTLGKWFNMQISMLPEECENCGEFLNPYAPWSARAYIAHLVPKRYFESVMFHPLNRVFLCIDCHTKFDNSISREVVQMNVWPIAVSRFKLIMKDIDQSEVCHLSPCFEQVYENSNCAL